MIGLLLAIASLGTTEEVWTVDAQPEQVLEHVRRQLSDPGVLLPAELAAAVRSVDVEARAYARTRERYYRAELRTLAPIVNGRIVLSKSLECWASASGCTFRSRITVGWHGRFPCVNRILARLIERAVIRFEQATIGGSKCVD